MALNQIAEQNLELMEELLELKRFFRVALKDLSGEIQDKFEAIDKENKQRDGNVKLVFEEFTKSLGNIQRAAPSSAQQKVSNPLPQSIPLPSHLHLHHHYHDHLGHL